MKPQSQYLEFAEEAVRLEQCRQWVDAAFAWGCAARKAHQLVNLSWAETRSDFCNGRAKVQMDKAA